ncbi:MAG TPA: NUDIX domain-containing protein [Candidatus Paceibacterota bacterium]
MLKEEIDKIINSGVALEATKASFAKRLGEGRLTRDENSASHFCVYFLPFNRAKKEVFVIHHKKARLWLSPGGHIDQGETILETLNREIKEELGVPAFFKALPEPFFFEVTPIENSIQTCKFHFDIWYLMQTDGQKFNVDSSEFLDTRWLRFNEARKIVSDPANLKALNLVEEMF